MISLIGIAYFSLLSPLLPLLLFLRKRVLSKEVLMIRILLIIGFLFDLLCLFMARRQMNSFPVGNIFYLIQTLILLRVYEIKFVKSGNEFRIIQVTYCILFIVNYFFIQGYSVLNTYTITLSAIVFSALALSYFLYVLKKLPEVFVYRIPMIWINIAVLVYFSGNLLVFLFNDFLIMSTTCIIHNLLNITKNLIFMIAIWQNQRRTSSFSF